MTEFKSVTSWPPQYRVSQQKPNAQDFNSKEI